MAAPEPQRGEVYEAELDPVEGREQSGRRPLLVLSIGPMNRSAAGLVIGVPLTTTDWGNSLHTRLDREADRHPDRPRAQPLTERLPSPIPAMLSVEFTTDGQEVTDCAVVLLLETEGDTIGPAGGFPRRRPAIPRSARVS